MSNNIPTLFSLDNPTIKEPPIKKGLHPFWSTDDGNTVNLYNGDALHVLRQMPCRSVQTVVTSPPYYGLRDYGTGTWKGGDSKCDHIEIARGIGDKNTLGGSGHLPDTNAANVGRKQQYKNLCKKCGAKRIDQQIGSEATPEEFIRVMVNVFHEVRRVLRNDGTLWLNLGDSYLPNGQLGGVPWLVALALQTDGWILRSDMPWVKRSAMPESVTNRPAKALEYMFLLTKSTDYYFDMEAVKKGMDREPDKRLRSSTFKKVQKIGHAISKEEYVETTGRSFRNADLWFESIDTPHGLTGIGDELVGLDVVSQAYKGAHFACFGTKLIEPCIKAGTSEYGACVECGAPWERTTKVFHKFQSKISDNEKAHDPMQGNNYATRKGRATRIDETTGWKPTCHCKSDKVRPCIVLDPFIGSGTSCEVAIENNRWSIGIDLSTEYLTKNAIPRIESVILREPVRHYLLKSKFDKHRDAMKKLHKS